MPVSCVNLFKCVFILVYIYKFAYNISCEYVYEYVINHDLILTNISTPPSRLPGPSSFHIVIPKQMLTRNILIKIETKGNNLAF